MTSLIGLSRRKGRTSRRAKIFEETRQMGNAKGVYPGMPSGPIDEKRRHSKRPRPRKIVLRAIANVEHIERMNADLPKRGDENLRRRFGMSRPARAGDGSKKMVDAQAVTDRREPGIEIGNDSEDKAMRRKRREDFECFRKERPGLWATKEVVNLLEEVIKRGKGDRLENGANQVVPPTTLAEKNLRRHRFWKGHGRCRSKGLRKSEIEPIRVDRHTKPLGITAVMKPDALRHIKERSARVKKDPLFRAWRKDGMAETIYDPLRRDAINLHSFLPFFPICKNRDRPTHCRMTGARRHHIRDPSAVCQIVAADRF